MKLKEVYLKQPETYKVLRLFIERESKARNRTITVRDLYTFFDRSKIWIEVSPTYDLAGEFVNTKEWFYTINNGTSFTKQDFNNKTYKSREECEVAAFFRAFELAEEKINSRKIKVDEKTN